MLSISGTEFGSSRAKVFVNGKDVSSKIVRQVALSIKLNDNKCKLNLKLGNKQIMIQVNSTNANTFILSL